MLHHVLLFNDDKDQSSATQSSELGVKDRLLAYRSTLLTADRSTQDPPDEFAIPGFWDIIFWSKQYMDYPSNS
jgi:hypothetical protein